MEKIFSVGMAHQRSRSCALIASASEGERDGAVDDQDIIDQRCVFVSVPCAHLVGKQEESMKGCL